MSIHVGMNPILLTLGSTEVRWYGLMVALAILTVVGWAYFAAKKAGIPSDVIYTSALWAIPFGLIISHLVGVVDRLDYYTDNPGDIFNFSGLTIYGAILGATLGVWIATRIKHQPFGQLADLAAPGIILGQAVGRIGCAINGCCYGTPTDLPWGFIYTNQNSFGFNAYEPDVASHPTVVYELLFDLAVFIMLLAVRHRLKASGSLFLLYLVTYSAGRFLFSYLRENTTYGGLREAQIIALAVLVVTVPLLVYLLRRRQAEAVPLKIDDK
jgi:phosphatidylglycerol---prolipoprotein diacylglyceryl transferase